MEEKTSTPAEMPTGFVSRSSIPIRLRSNPFIFSSYARRKECHHHRTFLSPFFRRILTILEGNTLPSPPACPKIVFPFSFFPSLSENLHPAFHFPCHFEREVRNLLAQSGCVQMLHAVQHDSSIGMFSCHPSLAV